MRNCILFVTDHEYDHILQFNHNALVWSNQDKELLGKLETVIGKDWADQVARFDRCRMQKYDDLEGVARVVEDAAEPTPGDSPVPLGLGAENARGEVTGCPTGLSSGPSLQPPEQPNGDASDGEPDHDKLGVERLEGRQESGRED